MAAMINKIVASMNTNMIVLGLHAVSSISCTEEIFSVYPLSKPIRIIAITTPNLA